MDKFSTQGNERAINNIVLDLRADAKEFGLTSVDEDIERLLAKLKEWGMPSKKSEIITTVVNANKGRVYVVTRDEADTFRVNRLFMMMGGNWEISVDIADRTLAQTFEELLADID